MINQAPPTYYATCSKCNARASKTLALTEQGALEEAMVRGFSVDPATNQVICGKCASLTEGAAIVGVQPSPPAATKVSPSPCPIKPTDSQKTPAFACRVKCVDTKMDKFDQAMTRIAISFRDDGKWPTDDYFVVSDLEIVYTGQPKHKVGDAVPNLIDLIRNILNL